MNAPLVRVKNRTGVTQVVAPEGIVLEPGVWSDPIPGSIAERLRRVGITLDVEGVEPSPETHRWIEDGRVTLHWMSPFSVGDGYATAAENMVHALVRQGAKVRAQYLWFLVETGLLPETLALLRAPYAGPHVVGVCMATPGEFRKLPTPYKVGWTMYESTNPLRYHPEWRHECNAVDRLFVPSAYCKEIFSKFVHVPPIDIVPLAINPIYCNPVKRTPKDVFTIICYATLTGRKAPLETLKVFQRAFPKDKYPDVRMYFKTRLGLFGVNENQLPEVDDSRVTIFNDSWLPERMHEYLDSADCMLFLSRGEGFGMPPREAMAQGIPTILTDNTGMMEVCDDRYNWPIPSVGSEPSPLGGDWDIPDWDYAVDVLRSIYHDQEKAYEKAYLGAKWFVANHGPDAAAVACIEALRQLTPFAHIEDRKEERKREARLVEIRVLEELRQIHDPFCLYLEKIVPPPGPLAVIGDETVADFFRSWDYKVCDTPTCADVCCSIDYMHRLTDEEVVRLLKKQLRFTSKVLFSVPSVHRAITAGVGERLLRRAQWRDILIDFDIASIRYYDNRQHILCHIAGLNSGFRGSVVRQGRMREGVWRPKR